MKVVSLLFSLFLKIGFGIWNVDSGLDMMYADCTIGVDLVEAIDKAKDRFLFAIEIKLQPINTARRDDSKSLLIDVIRLLQEKISMICSIWKDGMRKVM